MPKQNDAWKNALVELTHRVNDFLAHHFGPKACAFVVSIGFNETRTIVTLSNENHEVAINMLNTSIDYLQRAMKPADKSRSGMTEIVKMKDGSVEVRDVIEFGVDADADGAKAILDALVSRYGGDPSKKN